MFHNFCCLIDVKDGMDNGLLLLLKNEWGKFSGYKFMLLIIVKKDGVFDSYCEQSLAYFCFSKQQ